MKPYKNLVFDIGNVIVDIDFDVIVAEFQKLSVVDFKEILSYSKQNPIFDWMDIGKISAAQFRQELRKVLKPGVTDDEINKAWNSILINYPEQKFRLLRELKMHYKTFALSNINELHVAAINKAAQTKFGEKEFGNFFHRAYYSNEIGHRKPDKEIYEFIAAREKLVPAETFFVDDKEENIETARSLGWQAYHLRDRDKLHELLAELKII